MRIAMSKTNIEPKIMANLFRFFVTIPQTGNKYASGRDYICLTIFFLILFQIIMIIASQTIIIIFLVFFSDRFIRVVQF
jgi:hypothetical protein